MSVFSGDYEYEEDDSSGDYYEDEMSGEEEYYYDDEESGKISVFILIFCAFKINLIEVLSFYNLLLLRRNLREQSNQNVLSLSIPD